MESMLSDRSGRILDILLQLEKSILLLQEWNQNIINASYFSSSSDGMKSLAANCMMLAAIGEGFKKIDRISNHILLPTHPEIPWADVMGIRDVIAHGYFDIDLEVVWDTITNDLDPLLAATRSLIHSMEDVIFEE